MVVFPYRLLVAHHVAAASSVVGTLYPSAFIIIIISSRARLRPPCCIPSHPGACLRCNPSIQPTSLARSLTHSLAHSLVLWVVCVVGHVFVDIHSLLLRRHVFDVVASWCPLAPSAPLHVPPTACLVHNLIGPYNFILRAVLFLGHVVGS